ncbi:MAG: sce7726 family protein [Clostridia bacterium]|nr:sce7726 family protein [Clostridia bacterium]
MVIYDSDIRKLLIDKFKTYKSFMNDDSTKLVHEMDVCRGSSRVDIAVINGKMHGYEIKSERDSLERLPSQVSDYSKIFDNMVIVVSANHLEKANEVVPEWWGIYTVQKNSRRAFLKRERMAKQNRNIDSMSLLKLLWKEELIELLEMNNYQKPVKSKTRLALCEIIDDFVSHDDIKKFVRLKLKNRTNWRAVQLQHSCDD